ncbi:MAG TPA: hypothetical protein PLF32_03085 [Bacteroidales bacterium]|nr:hypothetical protein [Bacteroidales bacterium]
MKIVLKSILILLLLKHQNVFSQEEFVVIKDSIPIYEVVNNDFKEILDSFIVNEKKHSYYDSNLIFDISLEGYQDVTYIMFFLDIKRTYYYPNSKHDFKGSQIMFFYKGNYFIVNNITKYFDDRLLKNTFKIREVTMRMPMVSVDKIVGDVDDFNRLIWSYEFKDDIIIRIGDERR